MEIKQKYKYLIKGGRHTDLKFVGETNDVGEANQMDLSKEIFSRFCVGK